jgi:hypothetical protein
VCEIGSKVQQRGSVIGVKVLGALGLIDEGEADWKIIAIDVKDPMADKLNDIDDVERLMPGLLDATREWFKIYKMPTGKAANKFAADGKFYDKKFALETIFHDHDSWKNLIKGGYNAEPEKKKGINLANTSLSFAKSDQILIQNLIEESTEECEGKINQLDQTAIDTVYYFKKS